jgi:SlyX protein
MTKAQVPDPANRITELEIQIAHQQRAWDQLNEVVIEQSQRLSRLERLIVGLERQVTDLRESPKPAANLLDEKPPHY